MMAYRPGLCALGAFGRVGAAGQDNRVGRASTVKTDFLSSSRHL